MLPRIKYTRIFHAFLLIIGITGSAYAQIDSNVTILSDSTLLVADSTVIDSLSVDSLKPAPANSSSGFDSKVEYKAKDSMRFDVANQKVYLYGKGEVYYEDIDLKADYIELNLKTNEVFAAGVPDTNGVNNGTPVFNDKDQQYEAEDMRYNFQTKKGLITQAVTQQGDGHVQGGLIKKQPDNVIYIRNGRFCPCKDENAKTYIKAKKIKIIPDDKIVTGAANMKIGEIPTPLILPFAILPNHKGAKSGIVIPKYGVSPDQGIFLQDGGYYWAASDKIDFTFTGDIYSRGSWGLGVASNYRTRYKYFGNFQAKYSKFIQGSAETFDLREEQVYKIYWKHNQDPKANPYQSFTADVNINQNNRLDINSTAQEFLSNNFKSNINYTRKFGNSPFRLTVNSSYDQNTVDTTTTATFTLPQLTLNMDRVYPFKRKYKVGKDRWYEKIGFTYSTLFVNRLKGNQDEIFTAEGIDNNLQSGMKHNFGLNTSYKIMKVFSIQPTFNYTENWETRRLNRAYDIRYDTTTTDTSVIIDTVEFIDTKTTREFGRYGTWNAGVNLSTKIYGMFSFRGGPVKAFRHVITPTIGLNYTPDYTNSDYIRDLTYFNDTVVNQYSIFDGSISPNGTAPRGPQTGRINFDLRNNLEMKVRNRKDTVTGEKKIKLIDQFNLSSSYNMFADTNHWSDVRFVANTNLFNFFRVNYNSSMNLYAFEENSETGAQYVTRRFEFSKTGKLGRFTSHRLGINFTLGNKKQQQRRKEKVKSYDQSVVYQSIPWSLSVGYTYNHSKPFDEVAVSQALQFQATINITRNWKFEGLTNFDFEANDFGYTRFSLYRDLNCWEARISVVPKGGQQNYNFSINLKPQMFKDMKIERKRNFYDFN